MKRLLPALCAAALVVLTSPLRAQEQDAAIAPAAAPAPPDTYHVTWEGLTGRHYYLQVSVSMEENDWTYGPVAVTGTGGTLTQPITVSSTPPDRIFVRVQWFTDADRAPAADYDGDGLTNADEVTLHGTQPFKADTDGDGSPDGEEHALLTDPLDRHSAPTVLLPMRRRQSVSFTWNGSFSAGNYRHGFRYYDEDPAGTWPWAFRHLNGLDADNIQGLPLFHLLHEELTGAVPFSNPPPAWFTQQARPGVGAASAIFECDLKDEGGGLLEHTRVWARGAAPLDADLYVPVLIQRFHAPVHPPEEEPLSARYEWLRIPAGENLSENCADVLSGYNEYYPWTGYTPVTTHEYWAEPDPAGWKEVAQFVQTPTGMASYTIKVVVPEVTTDGKLVVPPKKVATKTLKVAKLVPVRDTAANPSIHIPLYTSGTMPAGGQLLNPGEDPDCFFVIVTDQSKAGQTPRIRITTECIETGFTTYSDSAAQGDANVIELEETGNNSGIFRTPSMILVSDDTDDDEPIDNIADDAKGDRSRKIALGGKVKVTMLDWALGGAPPPVHDYDAPVQKNVTVKAAIMADSVATVATVNDDIRRCNERLAQIGVRVKLGGAPQQGVQSPLGNSSVIEGSADPNYTPPLNGPPHVLAEAKTKAIGTAVRPAGDSSITLIYCQDVQPLSAFSHFPIARSPQDAALEGLIFLRGTNSNYIAAHELVHILTNRGHWNDTYCYAPFIAGQNQSRDPDYPATNVRFLGLGGVEDRAVNLLFQSPAMALNDVPLSSPGHPQKRLTNFQQSLSWQHASVGP